MLICVTGATGLIGKQTCIQLLKLNFKVIAPVSQIRQYSIKHNNLKYVEIGDFRNKINWSPVLRKVKCIIHCAAKNNFSGFGTDAHKQQQLSLRTTLCLEIRRIP